MIENPPRQDELSPPSDTSGLTYDSASGLWLPSDIASQAYVDSQYRGVINRHLMRLIASSITGAGTYPASTGGNNQAQSANTQHWALFLDPSSSGHLGRTGKSVKLKLSASVAVNDTAPGRSVTLGLFPVGDITGGIAVTNPNLGTVVPDSNGISWASGTLVANYGPTDELTTGDFDCPAKGWYCLAAVVDGAMTANSVVMVSYRFEVRNV